MHRKYYFRSGKTVSWDSRDGRRGVEGTGLRA